MMKKRLSLSDIKTASTNTVEQGLKVITGGGHGHPEGCYRRKIETDTLSSAYIQKENPHMTNILCVTPQNQDTLGYPTEES